MKRNKDAYRCRRLRNADVLRRVLRTLCIYHRKPMLSQQMTDAAVTFLIERLPARLLKRLRANEHDAAFVEAMRLGTPFVI